MTLFASVLQLDKKAIKALRITDPYSLHRVVFSLFADIRNEQSEAASHSSGLLYADQGGDFSGRKILMLSNRQPADNVDKLYGEVHSKPIPDGFLEHLHYRFKVIINPTHRDNASRKLIPLKGREAISEWFCQRAEDGWGFKPSQIHLDVSRVDVLQFNDKQQHRITLSQAHIQGLLTVTELTKFKRGFAQGLGRGRAFGCGLLQLVPLLDSPFDPF
jgi:CRISPR system Cascade subunit CasE